MKDYNIKQKLSNDKGITLVALIITIVVMIIIAGVAINTGTESLNDTRLKGFYTQLEIIQKRADDIATTNESYIDSNGNIVYLKEQGTAYANLTSDKKTKLQSIITSEGVNLNAETFRYFTVKEIEEKLDLTEIEYNVFIDFGTRTIIAEEGITIAGEEYHILKNKVYFAEKDTTKNQGSIELSYKIEKYGTSNYKITVTAKNTIGDGALRYKKTTTRYWETSSNLEIIINELTQYNIEYIDNNKNTILETIVVELDASGVPTVRKIVEK